MTAEYELSRGRHASAADGRCAMEWVSFVAGEAHTDEPACVSPVLRAVTLALNDGLDDITRQGLRPYLARAIGTVDDGLDGARAWMALDWIVRDFTPRWVAAAGAPELADRLRCLAPVHAAEAIAPALASLSHVRRQARARWGVEAVRGRGVRLVTSAPRELVVARRAAWGAGADAAWAGARLGLSDRRAISACALARSTTGYSAAILVSRTRPASAEAGAVTEVLARGVERSALALLDRMLPTSVLDLAVAGSGQTRSQTAPGVLV